MRCHSWLLLRLRHQNLGANHHVQFCQLTTNPYTGTHLGSQLPEDFTLLLFLAPHFSYPNTQGLLSCFQVIARGRHLRPSLPTTLSQSVFSKVLTGITGKKEFMIKSIRKTKLQDFPTPWIAHTQFPELSWPWTSSFTGHIIRRLWNTFWEMLL